MGRTKRKRTRKKRNSSSNSYSVEHQPNIIALKAYMTKNNWSNKTDLNLELRHFPDTGRGVATSSKILRENDILISAPYDLLITYETVITATLTPSSFTPRPKLTIHDLLTLFLIVERHKGSSSNYSSYINSLPVATPPLPWLLSIDDINRFPDEELRRYAEKSHNSHRESLFRLHKSIADPLWICGTHCAKRIDSLLLDSSTFTWAYVMVNTRAIYIDSDVFGGWSSGNVLSDRPCMALCPYLDMFNHSHRARTKAELKQVKGHRWVYQLATLTRYERFNQIFISYGSHDNVKLIMEYGFFLHENCYDVIRFDWREILEISLLTLSKYQMDFIAAHNLRETSDLYVGFNGMSFNLKAFLFVALHPDLRNFSGVIYGDAYSEGFLLETSSITKKLLRSKLEAYTQDLVVFQQEVSERAEEFLLVSSYGEYKKDLFNRLICAL